MVEVGLVHGAVVLGNGVKIKNRIISLPRLPRSNEGFFLTYLPVCPEKYVHIDFTSLFVIGK